MSVKNRSAEARLLYNGTSLLPWLRMYLLFLLLGCPPKKDVTPPSPSVKQDISIKGHVLRPDINVLLSIKRLDVQLPEQKIADQIKAKIRQQRQLQDSGSLPQAEALTTEILGLKNAFSQLRAQSIQTLTEKIQQNPTAPESATSRFRLAASLFDQARDDFFDAVDAAIEAEKPEPEFIDYSKSIALLDEVALNFPDFAKMDSVLYLKAWCFGNEISKQYNASTADKVFRSLVTKYPQSQYASQANYLIGLQLFEKRELDASIGFFQGVMKAIGETDRLYEMTLYRLAWVHYLKDEYQQSFSYMLQILDFAEKKKQGGESVSLTRPEMISYLARGLVAVADEKNISPLQSLKDFFATVEARPYEQDVYISVVDVLAKNSRFQEKIAVLKYFRQRWPMNGYSPLAQANIVNAFCFLKEEEKMRSAQLEFAKKYGQGSEWWNYHEGNEALQKEPLFIGKMVNERPCVHPQKEVANEQPADCASKIDNVVYANLASIKGCYENQLKRQTDLTGKLHIQATIKDGKIESVDVIHNTIPDNGLFDCVKKEFIKYEFPATCSAKKVFFPFALSPAR